MWGKRRHFPSCGDLAAVMATSGEAFTIVEGYGAGDGNRTHDIELGKHP
jgi:hypothetical protein